MISGLPVRRFLLSVTALTVGLAAAGLLTSGPAAAASLPDLRITITTTPAKASYAVGDAVTTVFTVVNAGAADAVGVHIDGGDEEGIDRAPGGVPRDPFDLAAGATHSFTWPGTINQSAYLGGAAHGVWTITNDAGEADPADNIGRYRIAVPGAVGDLSVKAFVDVKGDHNDSQPGLAGVTVDVADSTGHPVTSATTDSAGKALFKALPVGGYVLTVVDWQLEDNPATTEVRGDGTADVSLGLLPKKVTTSPSAGASASTTSPAGSVTTQPSASASATAVLAFTGSSSGPTLLAGVAVLIVGAVALIAVRRRRRRFIA